MAVSVTSVSGIVNSVGDAVSILMAPLLIVQPVNRSVASAAEAPLDWDIPGVRARTRTVRPGETSALSPSVLLPTTLPLATVTLLATEISVRSPSSFSESIFHWSYWFSPSSQARNWYVPLFACSVSRGLRLPSRYATVMTSIMATCVPLLTIAPASSSLCCIAAAFTRTERSPWPVA